MKNIGIVCINFCNRVFFRVRFQHGKRNHLLFCVFDICFCFWYFFFLFFWEQKMSFQDIIFKTNRFLNLPG
jgi:hypothetical protein